VKKRRQQEDGFSMIEVMFSVASLAVASLGVLGVLTFGAMAGDSAGDFSEATQLGREIIENIRVDRFSLNPFDPPEGLVNASPSERTDLHAAPLDSPIMGIPTNSKFKRNIQITQVEPDRMAKIQVRIYWTRQAKERSVESVAFARSGL
jgi:hypothetical protein